MKYPFLKIEKKWQALWAKHGTRLWSSNGQAGAKKSSGLAGAPHKYILDMFPYPSGAGLHVGHLFGYIGTDIYARACRLRGQGVLHPMGWDAFGLPAENYALQKKIHPALAVKKNIANFKKELKAIGLSYNWDHEINTTDPSYYRWTQWLFLQLYKRGLAYEAEAPINFCPSCKTGLAQEEIINGRCERCKTETEIRPLRQWHLQITAYADRLIDDLKDLEWTESIKDLQRHWIGRSQGYEVDFMTEDKDHNLTVFTTRLDTIHGVSFLALAPEHPLASKIARGDYASIVERYLERILQKTERDRLENNDISGVFTGCYVLHPLTERRIPVWISEYVLARYSTGAIMGVPAHDQRDLTFAQKFSLPIEIVVEPIGLPEVKTGHAFKIETIERPVDLALPYEKEGRLRNADEYTGLLSAEAVEQISQKLSARNLARKKINYKLRDWIFSRQRYWGEPIPIIHCPVCGAVPVPERDLPVTLPKVKHYTPTDTGESPLAAIDSWVKTTCPKCHRPAKRETNTMPQWAGSCWYYLRFVDPKNNKVFADKQKLKAWLPVDCYVGGAEHAVLHLMYARFWHKVLYDAKLVPTNEPFQKLINQGMILGPDHEKMSKSRGNTISPGSVIKQYGVDALRVYEMFMGGFSDTKPWSTDGIKGAWRFLLQVWQLGHALKRQTGRGRAVKPSPELLTALNKTIIKVSNDIDQFKFNTAISALMECLTAMRNALEVKQLSRKEFAIFLKLLFPFAPHISQELWTLLIKKGFLDDEAWPQADRRYLAESNKTIVVQINGKKKLDLVFPIQAEFAQIEKVIRDHPKIKALLRGREVIKSVFAQDRIVNFVLK